MFALMIVVALAAGAVEKRSARRFEHTHIWRAATLFKNTIRTPIVLYCMSQCKEAV